LAKKKVFIIKKQRSILARFDCTYYTEDICVHLFHPLNNGHARELAKQCWFGCGIANELDTAGSLFFRPNCGMKISVLLLQRRQAAKNPQGKREGEREEAGKIYCAESVEKSYSFDNFNFISGKVFLKK